MTDIIGGYKGSGYVQPLTKKQLEKMKKIMKKVPVLQAKNDFYHKIEEHQADEEFNDELKKLDS